MIKILKWNIKWKKKLNNSGSVYCEFIFHYFPLLSKNAFPPPPGGKGEFWKIYTPDLPSYGVLPHFPTPGDLHRLHVIGKNLCLT